MEYMIHVDVILSELKKEVEDLEWSGLYQEADNIKHELNYIIDYVNTSGSNQYPMF